MKRSLKFQRVLWVGALTSFFWAGAAQATNGYFQHGYGTKAKGRGGVGLAIADDAIAAANNPALFSKLENRIDFGVDGFMPKRGAKRVGGPAFNERSSSNLFVIPDFGFSRKLDDKATFGFTLYGNGGMNTDYRAGNTTTCQGGAQGNALCGQGPLGVDLEQLVLAPTLAYKLDQHNALGLSPLFVYQRFAAEGLQAFSNKSSDNTKLTNNGHDSSTGIGFRLGYLGTWGDWSVGAAYSPRIDMKAFSKYAGLFANHGDFDIPENLGVGVAWKASDRWLLGFDYNRVNYSDVPSVGNAGNIAKPLGSTGGPGFGWKDVTTLKLGAEYQATPKLTLRGGFNVGNNPISSSDVTFNILAPGVIRKHYTVGATYDWSKQVELSAHYMVAPRESVTGASSLGGTETIDMKQQSISVSIGYKY